MGERTPHTVIQWLLFGGPKNGEIFHTLDFDMLRMSNNAGDIYCYTGKDVILRDRRYRIGWTLEEPSDEDIANAIYESDLEPYE